MNRGSVEFTGALYAWRREPAESVETWATRVHDLQMIPLANEGWFRLLLTSSRSLLEAEQFREGPFNYEFLLRRGASNRFLLLSNHTDLTITLMERASLTARIHRPEINVHKVVNDLAAQPGKYAMGSVWARIEGQGQALRTGGLYGNDLGESELFRRLLAEMQAFRVTLRDVVTRAEVVSIGSKGEVGFNYNGAETLVEIDTVLHFLSSRTYLKWDVDVERYSV